ncbi:MAG: penicillin-binding protein activator [Chromatiales bacterium]|jgi:outer membrane PBP1 activator LpoA protein
MPILVRSPLLLPLLFILGLIQGCAPALKPVQPDRHLPVDTVLQAQVSALLAAGDPVAAARLLETKAVAAEPAQRDALLLQAGEIWAEAEAWEKVERILRRLAPPLPGEAELRRRLLAARLEISRRNLELALDLMRPPPGPQNALPLQRQYHRNMAEIFRLSGNLLESARQLSALDGLLQGTTERLGNQQELVQTLSTMTDTALSMLQPTPPGILGGWMDLVRIIKRQNEDPANFKARLQAWREEHPGHPALPELLAAYAEHRPIDQSSHIAVLLPRSGLYAKVAAAVRDGFMAAWYQRPQTSRPALRFYDSSDSAQILEVYQKAVQQGAQLVVGPLNKDGVNHLMQADRLPIPVLALNQVDLSGSEIDNLFQFALAPEDEAEQTAERAWLDGHTLALALTPNDAWGRRIYASFKQRWEALGGRVLEHQVYDPQGNDFSRPIRLLLNTDRHRARQGSDGAGPPRRTDAHFIFLVARAQKGRQLGPQLKFFHAEGLPIYATSHIYDSVADRERDRDLGQIRFVDTPWLLEHDSQNALSREKLQRLIPGMRGSYARFYAMGMDAFNLLPQLSPMRHRIGPLLHGKTGNLFMDAYHRIHRQLAWIELDNGVARITGYAPRLERPAPQRPGWQRPPERLLPPAQDSAGSARISPLR